MIIEDKNFEEEKNNNDENIKLQLLRENHNNFEIKTNEKTTKKNESVILLVNDNNEMNQINLKTKTTENNEKTNKSNEINNKNFYDSLNYLEKNNNLEKNKNDVNVGVMKKLSEIEGDNNIIKKEIKEKNLLENIKENQYNSNKFEEQKNNEIINKNVNIFYINNEININNEKKISDINVDNKENKINEYNRTKFFKRKKKKNKKKNKNKDNSDNKNLENNDKNIKNEENIDNNENNNNKNNYINETDNNDSEKLNEKINENFEKIYNENNYMKNKINQSNDNINNNIIIKSVEKNFFNKTFNSSNTNNEIKTFETNNNHEKILLNNNNNKIESKKININNIKNENVEFIKNKNNSIISHKNNLEKKNDLESNECLSHIKKFFNNLNLSCFNFHFFSNSKKENIIEKQNFSLLSKDIYIDDIDEFISKIKPKGLLNLGSCCYMNATLQCFYHMKEFTAYFLKKRKRIIKDDNCILTKGLLDLILGLSKDDGYNYYKPILFKNNLIEVDDLFEGQGGKDSGDLVETILTTCQQEFKDDSDFPDFTIDQTQELKIFIDIYHKNELVSTIITKLFNFYIRIESRCFNCGIKYYNISSENILYFGLKAIYNNTYNNNYNNNIINKLSIDQCLNDFIENGHWRENVICKNCQKKSNYLSLKTFVTLPKYLIMIFSRGKNENFECKIEFEENLDLKDFYKGIKGFEENTTQYKLFAGTILYGSGGYGHTVAFCKHFDDNYYIFNDSSYHKTTFEEIKKEKIYLLFYKKNEN